jgi:mannosyl-3-phosphoglycerate phosphatase
VPLADRGRIRRKDMPMNLSLLIFTDLDGTLLDYHTYSFQGAVAALGRLREHSVPLILVSSKTRAEILKLQARLGLNEPFISENGGAVFFPSGHALQAAAASSPFNGYRGIIFGRPYAYIRHVFAQFSRKYTLKGFGDMTVEEIMRRTGLDREEAALAARRDFSEPFLFLAAPRPGEMAKEAASVGLAITRGGRFYHLIRAGQDKGRAVAETVRLFRSEAGEQLVTVGLGDAENDRTMLEAVDIPVLIPGPDGTCEQMEIPGLRKAPLPGSRGWGMIIAKILDEVTQHKEDQWRLK